MPLQTMEPLPLSCSSLSWRALSLLFTSSSRRLDNSMILIKDHQKYLSPPHSHRNQIFWQLLKVKIDLRTFDKGIGLSLRRVFVMATVSLQATILSSADSDIQHTASGHSAEDWCGGHEDRAGRCVGGRDCQALFIVGLCCTEQT